MLDYDYAVGLFRKDKVIADCHKKANNCDPYYIRFDHSTQELCSKFGDLESMDMIKTRKRASIKLKIMEELEKNYLEFEQIKKAGKKLTQEQEEILAK